MKLASLCSGGKDSISALFWAVCRGHDVKVLVTLKSENPESYMWHVPNIDLVRVQAKAISLPLIFKSTKGEKEKELLDLKKALQLAKKKYRIQGVVSGALASRYQKERIEGICKELRLKCFNPLWHIDPQQYIEHMVLAGFEVVITGVAAEGLDETWLGKTIDIKALENLKELHRKYRFHLAFEGGEAETFVLDGPIFKRKIKIVSAEKIMEDENTGRYLIKKVELVKKGK